MKLALFESGMRCYNSMKAKMREAGAPPVRSPACGQKRAAEAVPQRGKAMLHYTDSEAGTERAGEALAAYLHPGDVVALYGGLGAGKTAFVRGLARGLGVHARVSSPTFTIVNEYPGPVPLFHFDMYRLGGADELFEIGWEDYLVRGGVCAVEWSENVEDAFYADTIRVRITKTEDGGRSIAVQFPDGRDGEHENTRH